MAAARDSVCSGPTASGKYAKRNPALVHFADSERSRRTSQMSANIPHYQLHRNSRSLERTGNERTDNLSRSRSRSRGRGTAPRPDAPPMSESDDDAGYDAAYEAPSASSSAPPTRPRTPDSSEGPVTPPSQSFKESSTLARSTIVDARNSVSFPAPSTSALAPLSMQMHLACVTSTDILNTLHVNDVPRHEIEPIVPFPYIVHWPELPLSPPLTPEIKSTAPAQPVVAAVEQPAKPQPEVAKAEKDQRRRTWSNTRPSDTRSISTSVMSAARRSQTLLNLLAPHPTVHFPASPSSERVFDIDSPIDLPEITPASISEASTSSITAPAARAQPTESYSALVPTDMKSEEPRSSLLAPPRPTHARSRSEPVVVTGPSPSLTALAAAAGITTPVSSPTIPVAVISPSPPAPAPVAPLSLPKSTTGSRKLQKKKKRSSAPVGSLAPSDALTSSNSTTPASTNNTTPASTVAFPIAERKQRVSALLLFSSSVPKGVQEEPTPKLTPAEEIKQMHRRNMSLPLLHPLITPPSTPDKPSNGQPQIVITPPTVIEGTASEVDLESPVASIITIKAKDGTLETKDVQTPTQKRSRFAAIFSGHSSAPAPAPVEAEVPKAMRTKPKDAKTEKRRSQHRRSKSVGSISSTSSRLSTWHSKLRTTVRTEERANTKLWPVPGGSAPLTSRSTDILLLSRPMDLRPLSPSGESLHPGNEVAAWGRASTLSHTMTLLMGSGSAARSTRRLRKAGGVVRTRPRSFWDPMQDSDEAAGEDAGEDGDTIREDYRWRAPSASTPSLLGPSPLGWAATPTPTDTSSFTKKLQGSDWEDSDCEDSDVPDLRRIRNSIDSSAREPVLSLLHELRRKRMLGRDPSTLPSSSTSTMSSVHSGTLLFRPLRPRRSASFSAASSMKLRLD